MLAFFCYSKAFCHNLIQIELSISNFSEWRHSVEFTCNSIRRGELLMAQETKPRTFQKKNIFSSSEYCKRLKISEIFSLFLLCWYQLIINNISFRQPHIWHVFQHSQQHIFSCCALSPYDIHVVEQEVIGLRGGEDVRRVRWHDWSKSTILSLLRLYTNANFIHSIMWGIP